MRYGKFLPDQGTIGFVAPSFGCSFKSYKGAFEHSFQIWEHMGYHLDCGPNVFEKSGIGISNTPEKCGEEFNVWYASKKNDVLISCGGGELMCGILDFIDFAQIRKADPKWFMGYSDNTNLTFLMATLCDTASIYGPCAPSFGMEPWHKSLTDAYQILKGQRQEVSGYDRWEKEGLKSEKEPLLPYHLTEKRVLRRHPDADCHMEGRLLGGCLDCLAVLCGTRYDKVDAFLEKYKEDGVVWFLEACDFNVMGIRRALWQLEHAGWFDTVKGFLIGRPLCFGQEMLGMDQYRAVTELLAHFDVPIIMDVDLGHLPPMMPIVCGSYGRVDVKGNDITVHMEYKE